MKTVVIGAGVVGATTALVLAERGIEVVLIDQAGEPGAGTSYANGSGLTPCHAEPWNPPGTARRLPAALFRSDQPWRLNATALPRMLGWGFQFLRHSRADRYLRNTRNCVRLGLYSSVCLQRLRQQHALDYDQVTGGSLELYFNAREFDHAIALRRAIGLDEQNYRRLDRDALVALEPALAPIADRVHGSLLFPTHESGDARTFSRIAAERAATLGAQLRLGETVKRIDCGKQGFHALHTDAGTIEADACIIAAGCASPGLLQPLGLRLPIQPVKGYSATIAVQPDDPAPTVPLLDLERRFVTARLGPTRLRIAGLAEFAGHDRGLDPRRLRMLLENAAALLPAMRSQILESEANGWTGLRPMTPDGAPLLGPTPIHRLFLNTGHGAMGWTHAAGSAELLADLLTGQAPAIDTDGLLAGRWIGKT
jgi:D-amino-acid dehydrogenase